MPGRLQGRLLRFSSTGVRGLFVKDIPKRRKLLHAQTIFFAAMGGGRRCTQFQLAVDERLNSSSAIFFEAEYAHRDAERRWTYGDYWNDRVVRRAYRRQVLTETTCPLSCRQISGGRLLGLVIARPRRPLSSRGVIRFPAAYVFVAYVMSSAARSADALRAVCCGCDATLPDRSDLTLAKRPPSSGTSGRRSLATAEPAGRSG